MAIFERARPSAIAWGLLYAWLAHFFGLLVWFNIDHVAASAWMSALGIVTFTHCFGEEGFFSHLPEVEGADIAAGGALGAFGVIYAAVALVRARTVVSLALAALAVLGHLSILAPAVTLLWQAQQREHEVRQSWPRGLTAYDRRRASRRGVDAELLPRPRGLPHQR